jgi:hypothetical protein
MQETVVGGAHSRAFRLVMLLGFAGFLASAPPASAQYSGAPVYQPPPVVQTPMQFPAQAYCPANTDVAPGTCICPGGTQFMTTPGSCTPGRCMCPNGYQWNGAQCVVPPPPPPPQPLCRTPCNAGQVCVNGVCVGNGDLRFTLMWDRPGDMDLHVITPGGGEISYQARQLGNGNLDRDDRVGIGPENVFWADSPPQGTYIVCVDPYQITTQTSFTLTIAQSGQAVRTMTGVRTSAQRGQCGRGSPNFVTEIVIAPPAPVNTCPQYSTYNPASGRCECQAGTQWNGSVCAPYGAPPCPYACVNGQSCVNGVCAYPSPAPAPIQGRWVPAANGVIPRGAVQGGVEANGQPLFVCRASYNGGVHVGKVVGPNCNIGWGGAEVTLPQYEVLVGRSNRWVPASGGVTPPNAIQGGQEANGTILFICRANYNGGVHVGKVVGTNCNIGWGGAEVTLPQYEVLTQ